MLCLTYDHRHYYYNYSALLTFFVTSFVLNLSSRAFQCSKLVFLIVTEEQLQTSSSQLLDRLLPPSMTLEQPSCPRKMMQIHNH